MGRVAALLGIAIFALLVAYDELAPHLWKWGVWGDVAWIVFVLMQVMKPIHTAVSANLGDRTAAWLYDRLTDACVKPAGMGHLEDPSLTADLTVAREFDAGMTGPPLYISMVSLMQSTSMKG